MVVVLLPSKEYVYLPLQHAMKDDPLRHLYRTLDKLEISYLDLTPRFRDRAAAGDLLFFEVDGHPNTQGYALIADAVAEFLRPLLSRARAGGAPEAVEREP
jgi:hypothetical protein